VSIKGRYNKCSTFTFFTFIVWTGKLSQWLSHDDSTIKIVLGIIIIL